LLIGAGLAILTLHIRSREPVGRPTVLPGLVGPLCLVAILMAFVKVADDSPFYYHGESLLFALAVGGLLWAIETAPQGFPAGLLSLAPVRWIGVISYGLYLWHWPIILWFNRSYSDIATRPRQILELAVIFGVASISFYAVERPIRTGRAPWIGLSKQRLAVVCAAAFLAVSGAALGATHLDPNSIAAQINDLSDSECPAGSPHVGSIDHHGTRGPSYWCVRTTARNASSPTVAVIGDSTSRALDPGMREVARERGWRYIQAGTDGCSVLRLVVPPGQSALIEAARTCRDRVPQIVEQLLAKDPPDVWIVSDRTGNDVIRERAYRAATLSMLRHMTSRGARVVLVLPPPPGQPAECAVKHPAPDVCYHADWYTRAEPGTIMLTRVDKRAAGRFPRGMVTTVSITDVLCPRQLCPPVIDGQLARYDGIHFTGRFSRKIVRIITERAKAAGVTFSAR
jgi:hypothetical protein